MQLWSNRMNQQDLLTIMQTHPRRALLTARPSPRGFTDTHLLHSSGGRASKTPVAAQHVNALVDDGVLVEVKIGTGIIVAKGVQSE